MAMVHGRPKFTKCCAFCNYWIGDAKMEFVSMGMGFKYDNNACGKCLKKGGAVTHAGSNCSKDYEPSLEAKKLM